MKTSRSSLSSADAQKHPVTLCLSADEFALLSGLAAAIGETPEAAARKLVLNTAPRTKGPRAAPAIPENPIAGESLLNDAFRAIGVRLSLLAAIDPERIGSEDLREAIAFITTEIDEALIHHAAIRTPWARVQPTPGADHE